MDVRLLGAVDVVVDGAPVDVGRAGERAVLALLALSAGRVVPAERLIDALWGEELPDDPANALQIRVSKLRRALRAAGAPAQTVVTRPPGYLLDVAPHQVDVHRVAQLLEQARQPGSDPRQAERLYTQAADLWRGAPLAEFSADWASAERARLEELHLTLLEERIELRLAAGRHAAVLDELDRLITEHPLRERFRAQQMVALYQGGRQADALEAFEATRRLLGDELGLDPSPELEAVRDAVLRQSPDLTAPSHRPAPSPSPPLPARLTSFVGRGEELARIRGLVHAHRLLTLTGPGGSGKTTLATEAARELTGRFGGGVALVELAGVEEAGRVPAAVADALRLGGDAAVDGTERLLAALAGREALLVLDNCEHVVDACAALVARLLGGCPDLHVLATSREPLAVPGEVQLPVHPLPVPAATATLDELAANDSVRLFRERAWAANPAFVLDEDRAAAVTQICRQLDGLPLALELAAARVASLPVERIAERLSDRFALLVAGPRTAQARHRTLAATVDWSHDLLDADEQVLFRRLAIFRSGWTLEAAETVCAAPPLHPDTVLDALTRLVARSLVVAEHERGGRFRMLETVRAYALGRLDAAGEVEPTARRHAGHYLDVVEQAAVRLRSSAQHGWLQRLVDERDNLDAALTWAMAHGRDDPDVGLRMVGALGWWWFFGRHDEGRRWVDRVLSAADGGGSAPARAGALLAASLVWRPGACVVHPSDRCAAAAAAALAAAEAAGEEHLAAYARTLLAVEGVAGVDVPGAQRRLAAAEEAFAAVGDDWGLALVAFVRAEIGFRAQTVAFETAEALAERAAAGFARVGDGWGLSAVRGHHGGALRMAGRVTDAMACYDESLRIAEELGLLLTQQWLQAEVGYCQLLLGDSERALQSCADAVETTRLLGTGPGEAFATCVQAVAARRDGRLEAAREGFAAAVDGLRLAGIGWVAAMAMTQAGFVAEQAGDLPAAEAAHRGALELGLAGAWVAVPGALEGLACVAAVEGDAAWAARLLGTAAVVRQRTGHPADAFEQEDIDRAATAARARLGEQTYAAAFAEGTRLAPATTAARPVRTA